MPLTEQQQGDRELAGIDASGAADRDPPDAALARLARYWPQLAAIAVVIGVWQLVVWTGWKAEYVCPARVEVGARLVENVTDSSLLGGLGTTMRRIASASGCR